MDIEAEILRALQSAGPYTLEEITREFNERERIAKGGKMPAFAALDGMVGAASVLDALRSLKRQGLAIEEQGEWNYIPPARPVEAKPAGRERQASLF